MKLQQGDYVEGLTEEQFDELIGIEPRFKVLSWQINKAECDMFIERSLLYNERHNSINHTRKKLATNPLSFTEFKQRAINTFER